MGKEVLAPALSATCCCAAAEARFATRTLCFSARLLKLCLACS
jgi:hypothetical protein